MKNNKDMKKKYIMVYNILVSADGVEKTYARRLLKYDISYNYIHISENIKNKQKNGMSEYQYNDLMAEVIPEGADYEEVDTDLDEHDFEYEFQESEISKFLLKEEKLISILKKKNININEFVEHMSKFTADYMEKVFDENYEADKILNCLNDKRTKYIWLTELCDEAERIIEERENKVSDEEYTYIETLFRKIVKNDVSYTLKISHGEGAEIRRPCDIDLSEMYTVSELFKKYENIIHKKIGAPLQAEILFGGLCDVTIEKDIKLAIAFLEYEILECKYNINEEDKKIVNENWLAYSNKQIQEQLDVSYKNVSEINKKYRRKGDVVYSWIFKCILTGCVEILLTGKENSIDTAKKSRIKQIYGRIYSLLKLDKEFQDQINVLIMAMKYEMLLRTRNANQNNMEYIVNEQLEFHNAEELKNILQSISYEASFEYDIECEIMKSFLLASNICNLFVIFQNIEQFYDIKKIFEQINKYFLELNVIFYFIGKSEGGRRTQFFGGTPNPEISGAYLNYMINNVTEEKNRIYSAISGIRNEKEGVISEFAEAIKNEFFKPKRVRKSISNITEKGTIVVGYDILNYADEIKNMFSDELPAIKKYEKYKEQESLINTMRDTISEFIRNSSERDIISLAFIVALLGKSLNTINNYMFLYSLDKYDSKKAFFEGKAEKMLNKLQRIELDEECLHSLPKESLLYIWYGCVLFRDKLLQNQNIQSVMEECWTKYNKCTDALSVTEKKAFSEITDILIHYYLSNDLYDIDYLVKNGYYKLSIQTGNIDLNGELGDYYFLKEDYTKAYHCYEQLNTILSWDMRVRCLEQDSCRVSVKKDLGRLKEILKEAINKGSKAAENVYYVLFPGEIYEPLERRNITYKSLQMKRNFSKCLFVVDGINNNNLIFLNSIPEDVQCEVWLVCSDGDKISYKFNVAIEELKTKYENVRIIDEKGMSNWISDIDALGEKNTEEIKCYKKTYFISLSDDLQHNLCFVSNVYSSCYMQYQKFRTGREAYFVSDNIEIIANVNVDEAEECVRYYISDKTEFYIPTRYVSYNNEISKELLTKQLLYISDYGNIYRDGMKIVLFGDDEKVIQLCKDILAIMWIDEKGDVNNSITVFCKEKNRLENIMKLECEGLYDSDDWIQPKFIEYDGTITLEFDENSGAIIDEATHIICAESEDSINIKNAKNIRKYIMRKALKYGNREKLLHPNSIMVVCKEQLYNQDMSDFFEGEYKYGKMWSTDYRIRMFGSRSYCYSYNNLIDNILYEMGWQFHLHYYKAPNTNKINSTTYEAAKKDYYTRYYNIDSSIMGALYLPCRFLTAGVYKIHEKWNIVDFFKDFYAKQSIYENYLSENCELYAKQEHTRWSYYMLTRGWKAPESYDVIKFYIAEGNPGHQLFIAKYHPCICKWSNMDDMQNELERIWKNAPKGVKELPVSFRQIDIDLVMNSVGILRSTIEKISNREMIKEQSKDIEQE